MHMNPNMQYYKQFTRNHSTVFYFLSLFKMTELVLGDIEPYPLQDMLRHFLSRSFALLQTILDLESSNEDLMNTLNTIYINAAKILVIYRWNKKYPNSANLCNYLINSQKQQTFITDYLTSMHRLYNSDMDKMKTPMFDVVGAIDMVVGRGYSRLPLMIYPPLAEPKYGKDPKPMLDLIKDKLIAYLTAQTLPNHSKVSFEDGVAKIHVPNQYNLYLSFTNFDSAPKVANIEILLKGFLNLHKDIKYADKRGVSFVDQAVIQKVIRTINEILEKYPDHAFMKVNKVMHQFCVAFEMQRLITETQRIRLQKNAFYPAQNKLLLVIFKTQTEIAITKEEDSLPILLNGEKVGDAFGRSIDEIIEECKILRANAVLRSLSHEFPNSTVTITDNLPVLNYEDAQIYIDKWMGNYVIRGNPELTQALNENNFSYVASELARIRKNKVLADVSFTEPW